MWRILMGIVNLTRHVKFSPVRSTSKRITMKSSFIRGARRLTLGEKRLRLKFHVTGRSGSNLTRVPPTRVYQIQKSSARIPLKYDNALLFFHIYSELAFLCALVCVNDVMRPMKHHSILVIMIVIHRSICLADVYCRLNVILLKQLKTARDERNI